MNQALRTYLLGLFEGRPSDRYPRINHTNLHDTVLAIAGALEMYADSVEPPAPGDHWANVVQFTVAGRRYCICRRRKTRLIEIRETLRSPALHVFDGREPVHKIFVELAHEPSSTAA